MAYVLDGTNIRAPYNVNETNNTQLSVQRTLSGAIRRQYFGANKRVWTLDYKNTQKSEYEIIRTIYNSYLSTGTTKTWAITETNYTISVTNVHVDLLKRDFSVKGSDYISDFTLVLTET